LAFLLSVFQKFSNHHIFKIAWNGEREFNYRIFIDSNLIAYPGYRTASSGVRFESMAYYMAQSTQSERYNYLVWKVTNKFQLFDPMVLLSIKG